MASLRSKVDAASVQVLIADRTASYGKIQCDRAELDLVSSHIAITHTAAHKLMGILVIAGAVVAIVLLWEGRSLASIGWRGFALVSWPSPCSFCGYCEALGSPQSSGLERTVRTACDLALRVWGRPDGQFRTIKIGES